MIRTDAQKLKQNRMKSAESPNKKQGRRCVVFLDDAKVRHLVLTSIHEY